MPIASALSDLNNAILDLQAAEYDTYARPLKKIAHALADADLRAINDDLKAKVDFDAFAASAPRAGMGSDVLSWPLDKAEELGLALILIERGAADPSWFLNFAHRHYDGGRKIIDSIRKIVSAVIIPFGRDYKAYVTSMTEVAPAVRQRGTPDRSKVFIVHGHQQASRAEVARMIERQGIEAIILHEQTSRGMTVAEKLDAYGEVGFAVVIMTPDDLGRANGEADLKPRARQNVILELGYFLGRLGRDKVCALKEGDIEIPSDYDGVVYTALDAAGAWKFTLARELRDAGYAVDMNLV